MVYSLFVHNLEKHVSISFAMNPSRISSTSLRAISKSLKRSKPREFDSPALFQDGTREITHSLSENLLNINASPCSL
jgi:hypothetical protein